MAASSIKEKKMINFKMNSFAIKILGCIFMAIDHIGVILFPKYIGFRVIGRLSFPLFAWMISMGYVYSRNVKKYLSRLLIFAIVMELPFLLPIELLKNTGKDTLNIFFTLALGLLSIYVYDKTKNKGMGIVIVLIIGLFGEFIKVDYGLYGVLTIFFFYVFRENYKKLLYSLLLINVLYVIGTNYTYIIGGYKLTFSSYIQLFSVLALGIVFNYNGQKGRSCKYLFYFFYPVHLIILYLISTII